MPIELQPPVAGEHLPIPTDAGMVSAYVLGEAATGRDAPRARTVLLLHSFNAAGSGIELAPLARRLAERGRRVVLVDWLGFGTSERPDAPYGPTLYGEQLELIRQKALAPGETALDVVALSLPSQYVVAAAAAHPERFGRLVLISPTGFGRFGGNPSGPGPLARLTYAAFKATGFGRLVFAVLARRQVIDWFIGQIFAEPRAIPDDYARYSWRSAQQAGAFHAPLAFVSGLLNDPAAPAAYRRVATPTLLVFGDRPRFTDPIAAEELVESNPHLRTATVEASGDLPQLERPDATAELIEAFLAG